MTDTNSPFRRGPSVGSFFFTLIVGIGAIVYISFSVYARDHLWFWPTFEEIPSRILVRCYGEDVNLQPGSVEFREITRLVNEQLSGDKQWQDITISNQTFSDFQTDPMMVILELGYTKPVDVHTGTAMFIDINTLITPLVGRFANENIFLGAKGPNFTGGRVHVQDTQPIKDYISQSTICVIK
jgi:hypothetical protein